jgi:hypothetical protein
MGTVNSYSALSSPATDDCVLAWDTSAGATKKIPISALGVDLPSLMTGYSTISTAAADDTLFVYDTSAAAMKKIAAGDLAYDLAAEIAAAASLSSPADTDLIPIYDISVPQVKAVPYSTFTGNLKANGSVALTGNWDAGAGRVISLQYLRARSAAGLRIESDGADLGVYIHDDGKVGIGTTAVTTAPTASLTTPANVKAGYDTDTASYFGRAAIGSYAAVSDTATFAHIDHNETDPALLQAAGGATEINAATGQYVRIAVGGSPGLILNASNQVYNPVALSSLGTTIYPWATVHATTVNATTVNASTIASAGNLTISANGSARLIYNHVNNTLDPSSDGGQGIGRSGARYTTVWATNGTIQTSDARLKRDIETSDLGLAFVRDLHPVRYRWIDFSDDERAHYGLIAQEVQRALLAHGRADFGGHIYDSESDRHSLGYTEFISPLIRAIQEIADRLDALEAV